MHSDQMGKDGISEPMIQPYNYYDFVANYVKTRMYGIRYDAPYTLRCTTSEPLRRIHRTCHTISCCVMS